MNISASVPHWPEGPFDVIAADPPWTHDAWTKRVDVLNTRAPARHYKTQSLDWICRLPVEFSAAKDCHLFLWITGPHLARGDHLKVLAAWGFAPSSIAFVWGKPNRASAQGSMFFRAPLTDRDFFMGLGKTTRQNAEFVVLGRRGKPKRHSAAIRQIIIEERREHSRKPEGFYEKVEAYVGPDARKLDLFPRERREGWEAWGNEIDKFSVLGALQGEAQEADATGRACRGVSP